MNKLKRVIDYFVFIFSGWITEEITFSGGQVRFKRKHNSVLFNPIIHFEELASSLLKFDSNIIRLNKKTFKYVLSNSLPSQDFSKSELEANFYFNQLPIVMKKFSYNENKTVNSLFVYKFGDFPLLVLNMRYDYGKYFNDFNESIQNGNGSSFSCQFGGEVLVCNGEQYSSFLYTPHISLLGHLFILSSIKAEKPDSSI
ncbi:hypothetical protein [Belliella aquatica]|uniref:Uncharacterized protein n=1 Tax=Belliella aquatica TaxID=1323734 RepID=A0ABQ1N785_9BACT|nr:hypothetical protein [Belliella aquatica]MCH7407385.1 hypothetical protein [Belliella aquatica]GGC53013.1 hypothetical protein GCM10010993_34300 [Belliella aquatica]